MSTANTKSTAITNADASPRVANNSFFADGEGRYSVGYCAKLAGDGNNSVYRFFRVPSNARIHSLSMLSDALAGATAADVGIYDTAANGGAAVAQHAYAQGVDIHLGYTTPSSVFQKTAANLEKRVWEDAGLSVDPFKEFDLCVTLTTAGGAAGNIGLMLSYTL